MLKNQVGINIKKYQLFCNFDVYIIKTNTNKNENLYINTLNKYINKCT